jgi:sulfoxide reductase heme-binding subunit YedZ
MADIPWTWLGIRASGITAWGLLSAVVIWGLLLRSRLLGGLATPVRLLELHRWLGALALGFLVAHLGLLLVDPAVHFTVAQILVPGLAPWNTTAVAFGVVALWLLIPVSVVGRIRTRLGKAGNAWFSRTHLLAYAAWPFATAHYVLAGTDALAAWSLATLVTGVSLVVLSLLARGFVPPPKPARRTRHAAAGASDSAGDGRQSLTSA